MLVYTIVLNEDTEEDAALWAAHNLDPEMMTIRSVETSAFLPHKIVRVEARFDRVDDYARAAFEGGLNGEMNDPLSDVVWWTVWRTNGG